MKKEADGNKKGETGGTGTDTPASSPPVPPVEAAARRLDRLLGGPFEGARGGHANADAILHSSPSKTVKRWLGTSSGTARKATLLDLAAAARALLDPAGACANGRDLLIGLSSSEEKDVAGTEGGYLSVAAREAEAWLLSLSVRILWRDKKHPTAFQIATNGIQILTTHLQEAMSATVGGAASSLYPLLARMHRYQSLTAESLVNRTEVVAGMRQGMVQAYRMACLRRNVDTQATLLNLLLRDLLQSDQVEQAQKLLVNSTFPDSASNNQLCRYLYHSGRIQALRLEYTSAFSNLSQCLRKAPTNTGLGFRIAAQRLLVILQLLMGEIPERNVFFTKGMRNELAPYMKITQAVRRGDLAVFHETVSHFASRLKQDGTYTLISRLAHSVVKAGLRKLHMSYSRISLQDVAQRLGLPSATSAEFVVSKAVRDGVIDATINHEGGYVQSHDLVDVYATTEPAEAFHRRIAYCLTTHNDAVRGMRYPPDAYKEQLEASRGLRGKKDQEKTDEEKAQELEDELDEDY